MEGLVGQHDRCRVAQPHRERVGRRGVVQRGEAFRSAEGAQGFLYRQGFEGQPYPHQRGDAGIGHLHQPHALVGCADHDALAFQQPQGFPHRYPADAEVAGDFGLDQPVPREEYTAGGGGHDGLGRLLHHCAGLDRRQPPGVRKGGDQACGRVFPRPEVPNSHVLIPVNREELKFKFNQLVWEEIPWDRGWLPWARSAGFHSVESWQNGGKQRNTWSGRAAEACQPTVAESQHWGLLTFR